jgi:hypothetical protein
VKAASLAVSANHRTPPAATTHCVYPLWPERSGGHALANYGCRSNAALSYDRPRRSRARPLLLGSAAGWPAYSTGLKARQQPRCAAHTRKG